MFHVSVHIAKKYVLFAVDHFSGEKNGKAAGRMCVTVPHVVEDKRSQGRDSGRRAPHAFVVKKEQVGEILLFEFLVNSQIR